MGCRGSVVVVGMARGFGGIRRHIGRFVDTDTAEGR